MNRSFIPFHRPEIGADEIQEVVSTLQGGWLTSGERAARFEKEFQRYVGSRHALATCSGTAALHLALAALNIGPGDEVITTPLTFCATVNAILYVGATPVLADVQDGNIDPASIEERITPKTRAILPVHLAGAPCQMDRIWALAERSGVAVVEDAAHACGTLYRGRHVGSMEHPSEAVAFSFYATKNLTTGEGGMVTANDAELMARMRSLCLHGISKDAWKRYEESGTWYYEVLETGFKYNLSDIQSAIGIHQLRRLGSFLERRAAYADLYTSILADLEEVETPPAVSDGRHSWHLYIVRLNLDRLEIDRDSFIQELRRKNICTSVHFIPIPLHPFFARWAKLPQNQCPRCLELYPRLISLPLYPAMTEAEVEFVAQSVKEIARQFRKRHFPAMPQAKLAATKTAS